MNRLCERCNRSPADRYVRMLAWGAHIMWHRFLCTTCTRYLGAIGLVEQAWDLDGREMPVEQGESRVDP